MAYLPNDEFKELAKKIHSTGEPLKMTPKKLLSYFGAGSRKIHVKWWVDHALGELKIKTVPDYRNEYQHAEIELTTDKILSAKKVKDKDNEAENDDIVQRLKLLDASNRIPKTIDKNSTIEEAMTIMMMNDYSQLPVMNSPNSKDVDGMISWHSIGRSTVTGTQTRLVKDFMSKEITILKYEMPLLDAVDIIKNKEVILVQKKDKSICGLVTITDIAIEFYSLAEPFFLIGQIESVIREIIGDKFNKQELESVKYQDDKKDVQSPSDLTFNEYIELFRKGNNWDRLNLTIDKSVFTKRLEEVRDIRNDIMHFSTDNIEDAQVVLLRQTAKFIRELINR
jgi:predicted transcriptional regulator